MPVAAGEGPGEGHCFVPEGFTEQPVAEISAPQLILRAAESHKDKLVIIAIGALSPLAAALRQDTWRSLNRLAAFYFQGSVDEDAKGRMIPSTTAFNKSDCVIIPTSSL